MSAPASSAASGDRKSRTAPVIGWLHRLASREVGLSLLVLVAFLAAWEWLPAVFEWPTYIIPPLSGVVEEFIRAFGPERLAYHTGITAFEVLVGFALGAALGMLIGFVLGTSPTTELVFSPYILALQIAPKVAFAPLFVMWFGFTLSPRILVAVLIVFFPIMVNVLSAMRSIDPAMINLARSFKATRMQIFRKIEFPAALPPLFAGLRIGSTLAVIGVVVGEFAGGNQGVGVVLNTAAGAGNTPLVFGCILLLTLIGILAYVAIVALEARVLHYMPKRELGHVGTP
jgi:NitT/TauT family transport system permease protein